jgi:hypothetical protein
LLNIQLILIPVNQERSNQDNSNNKMANPPTFAPIRTNSPTPAPDDILAQAWFQYLWKTLAVLLVAGVVLGLLHVYRKYWGNDFIRHPRRNITAAISNRQANVLWGTNPGVVVDGGHSSLPYRIADGKGDFGITPPSSKIPELQEVHARTVLKDQNSNILPNHFVIAIRVDESNIHPGEEVIEATSYDEVLQTKGNIV